MPEYLLLLFRILDSVQEIWENSKNKKYYASMFNKIEAIFELLGFNDDVCELSLFLMFNIFYSSNTSLTDLHHLQIS